MVRATADTSSRTASRLDVVLEKAAAMQGIGY